uniref:Uncharacterized protein n=1 Tax=Streptococcus thermophilus TaxID=1308 RepID=Q70LG9_STRTR|nr:hypothetical protein [Streptococcus thermophilus]
MYFQSLLNSVTSQILLVHPNDIPYKKLEKLACDTRKYLVVALLSPIMGAGSFLNWYMGKLYCPLVEIVLRAFYRDLTTSLF